MDCVHIGTLDTFVALTPAKSAGAVRPVNVSIVAGPFRGGLVAELDIRTFRHALGRVYQTLEGTAALNGSGGVLDLELTGDGRGKVTLTAKARATPHRVELGLTVDLNQSDLLAVLSSIDRLFLSSPTELD